MRVYVIVSDCGLNGPWIHGVFTEEPTEEQLDRAFKEAVHTTGYQYSYIETVQLGEWVEA